MTLLIESVCNVVDSRGEEFLKLLDCADAGIGSYELSRGNVLCGAHHIVFLGEDEAVNEFANVAARERMCLKGLRVHRDSSITASVELFGDSPR